MARRASAMESRRCVSAWSGWPGSPSSSASRVAPSVAALAATLRYLTSCDASLSLESARLSLRPSSVRSSGTFTAVSSSAEE